MGAWTQVKHFSVWCARFRPACDLVFKDKYQKEGYNGRLTIPVTLTVSHLVNKPSKHEAHNETTLKNDENMPFDNTAQPIHADNTES